MAIIQSGASADQLTIDPTSKALRATLYDDAGGLLYKKPSGVYATYIDIDQTVAEPVNTVVWGLSNASGSNKIYVRKIGLTMSFDGTAAAVSPAYELMRFTAGTLSAGNQVTPIKLDTSFGDSQAVVRYLDTGLTETGMTYEEPLAVIRQQAQLHATKTLELVFSEALDPLGKLALSVGQGLVIRVRVAMVIGITLSGFVVWEER